MTQEKRITEKILFSDEAVFADICNGFLFNGSQIIQPEDLRAVSPVPASFSDGGTQTQERSISKMWAKGNIKISLICIENQTNYDPDMPILILDYDGADYESQADRLTSGNLDNAYPVISLVLYFGTEHKWEAPTSLYECLGTNLPELFKPFVSDYKINVFNVAFLKDEEIARFRSDFRLVAEHYGRLRQQKQEHSFR